VHMFAGVAIIIEFLNIRPSGPALN
jgi:hypothetical protein